MIHDVKSKRNMDKSTILQILAGREVSRQGKDWATSDRIRDELRAEVKALFGT